MDRKLATILCADVVGYSRLTSADEEGTYRALSAFVGDFRDSIVSHGGRVVKETGDGLLAEFGSVVKALTCAVEVQKAFAERNRERDDDRKLEFRIGVNLGDIIVDRNDIFGDGVNVAARLETIADPGGICVSAAAYEHAEGKVDVAFDYIGKQTVKNIPKPIPAYKVVLDGAPGRKAKPSAGRPKTVLIAAGVAALVVAGGAAAVLVPWGPDGGEGTVSAVGADGGMQAQLASLTAGSGRLDPRVLELSFWNAVKDADDASLYCAYLEKYPEGMFAQVARLKAGDCRTSTAPYTDCDRYASHPSDRNILANPLYWDQIDVTKALAACSEAVKEYPDVARLEFQYGRVFHKAGDLAEAMRWYRKAAGKGYSIAINNIGSLFETGQGVEQSYEKAVELYKQSSKQGLALAQLNVGRMYEAGNGVPQDHLEALRWYQAAADQGFAVAQASLARLYETGRGVAKDMAKAVEWYQRAAEQDFPRAQYSLAQLIEQGHCADGGCKDATHWYTRAAENGYHWAQYRLGVLYDNGHGVAQDAAEAAKWYGKAADQGIARAQSRLAALYDAGLGVDKDPAKAAALYREAATFGYLEAQYNLARKYRTGEGVEKDDGEAVKWFRRAADQGLPTAQVFLAKMFEKGDGVAADPEKAFRWYTRAAHQGDAAAQSQLARLYEQGTGTEADMDEAVRLYRLAANQGSRYAQFRLNKLQDAAGADDAFAPGSSFRECDTCPEMVVVPAGSFVMGTPRFEVGRHDDEGPQRTVTIEKPFAVGKFEVTVAEYRQFAQETGRSEAAACHAWTGSGWKRDPSRTWMEPGFAQTDADPVVCVNWLEARGYAEWLAAKTGQPYRLLTEAEWEYAARAGTTTARYWGPAGGATCRHANGADLALREKSAEVPVFNCHDGHVFTAPVGSFHANGFGVHDMLGNVSEWVEDCWYDSYRDASTNGSASRAEDRCRRVVRGGAWINWERFVRAGWRGKGGERYRSDFDGFRVARTLP